MNFLIIDDDEESCQLLSKVLETDFKGTVTIASSGEEALYHLVSNKLPVDVILLDVLMPDMNGIETCIRIREQALYEFTPILFVSASIEKEHFINAFSVGGTDFVRKPIDRIELKTRIKLAIKNEEAKKQLLSTINSQKEVIAKLSRSFEQLSGKLPFDPSTNLFTRPYMETLIQQEWLRHKRTQSSLSLILIRIEGQTPEQFNRVAIHIESTCRRAADLLGLWNNNTFAALIAEGKTDTVQKLSEIIKQALLKADVSHFYIGGSVCSPPMSTGQSKDLIEGSQSAILEAKKLGPGSISVIEVLFSSQPKKVG